MRYRNYDHYKNSGVVWFGEIPKHWGISHIKRGYSVKLGKMLQPDQKLNVDVLRPYIRASNAAINRTQ